MTTRKLPKKTIKLLDSLYKQAIPITEIARKANVSYSTAWGYTKAKEKGFESLNEYREHLAKERQERELNIKLAEIIETG